MYCEAVSRVSSSVLLIGEAYTRCHLLSIGERLLLTRDLRRATLRGMKVPFNQWLQAKLKELKLTQADVIKNAGGGIKSSQMSRVYNGGKLRRQDHPDDCQGDGFAPSGGVFSSWLDR